MMHTFQKHLNVQFCKFKNLYLQYRFFFVLLTVDKVFKTFKTYGVAFKNVVTKSLSRWQSYS